MIYRLSGPAMKDLEEISSYIALDSVQAADETITHILDGIEQLVRFPRSARVGAAEGTRELVIAPYRITYEIHGDVIEVLSVIHGKRKQN